MDGQKYAFIFPMSHSNQMCLICPESMMLVKKRQMKHYYTTKSLFLAKK